MIRVFPSRTGMTPTDPLAFAPIRGKADNAYPRLLEMPKAQPVRVSVTFTWDMEEGERLYRAWSDYYENVKIGGPAYGDTGGEFVPNRFVGRGGFITMRGCCFECTDYCSVPEREGQIRLLPITYGHDCLDNNLFACPDHHVSAVFDMLREQDTPAKFSGGADARCFNQFHRDLLDTIKWSEIFFACDTDADFDALAEIKKKYFADTSANKLRCFTMFDPRKTTMQQADARARRVYKLGFLPFAQLYQGQIKKDWGQAWNRLGRYWKLPAIYRSQEK